VRIHGAFAVGLGAFAAAWATSSPAWGSPAGSSDESLRAQPLRSQTNVTLTFDPSAADLPKEDIRTAVARELERRPTDEPLVGGELAVGVEGNHLVVRFRSADGYTERLLPLPEDRAQVPLLLALLASTLTHDQRAGVRPAAPPPERAREAPAVKPAAPSYKHHYLGLHVAQDILFVGGDHICDPQLGVPSDNFACFYAGTEEPFFHRPAPSSDSIRTGPALATTRVLLSYDLAPWSVFSFGVRAGFALRGGPPGGMGPADPSVTQPVPAHMPGQGGTAFLPYHLELRASYWFVPLTNPGWHAYAGLGAGIAQIDAKVHHYVVDCEDVAQAAGGTTDAYDACVNQDAGAGTVPPTPLDAWRKAGQVFAAVHAGGRVNLVGELAAELTVNVMFMSPWNDIALEPSLGLVMGL